MDAAEGAQPGAYDARLELVVSSRILEPLAYVYADGKLIGTALPPQLGIALDLKTVEMMRGGVEFQQFVQILREVTETDETVADSYVRIFTDSYERSVAKAIDHVYDTVFMGLFPGTDWLAARDKMREHGLLGFENASFAAVRGLARLSQASCLPISDHAWKTLVSEIRDDGDSPDPVDEAMRFFGPESRMRLMGRTDTHWLVWI